MKSNKKQNSNSEWAALTFVPEKAKFRRVYLNPKEKHFKYIDVVNNDVPRTFNSFKFPTKISNENKKLYQDWLRDVLFAFLYNNSQY